METTPRNEAMEPPLVQDLRNIRRDSDSTEVAGRCNEIAY